MTNDNAAKATDAIYNLFFFIIISLSLKSYS
ncbi:Uncharacterised protein [Segatella copri]|nr:Uncharacterised protein [Segatella copri]